MRSLRPLLAIAAALALPVALAAGCGGPPPASSPDQHAAAPSASAPSTGAPASPEAAPAPSASGQPKAAAGELPASWQAGMSKEQQVAFMKAKVMPRMAKVFQEHDGKRYAQADCKTCHGPQYKEPKEFLPHLTMKDGKITSFADKPEISKWMAEKVAPEMAQAMGLPPYDAKTHQGFGCGGCHAIDMK